MLDPISHPKNRHFMKHHSIGIIGHKADNKASCPGKKERVIKKALIELKKKVDLHKYHYITKPNDLRGLIHENMGQAKEL